MKNLPITGLLFTFLILFTACNDENNLPAETNLEPPKKDVNMLRKMAAEKLNAYLREKEFNCIYGNTKGIERCCENEPYDIREQYTTPITLSFEDLSGDEDWENDGVHEAFFDLEGYGFKTELMLDSAYN